MDIVINRGKPSKISMIGTMFVNNKQQCYTLEDIPREVKVKSETAIPAGKYKVILTMSNRFKKVMPLLLDVPNFEGIRIHSGNTNHDTEGCILVGTTKGKDFIGNSREAYKALFTKIKKAIDNKEEVYITLK